MRVPMPPTSSIFLYAEARSRPMHVGGLALLRPPAGTTATDLRERFRVPVQADELAPVFRKRARRGPDTLGQWVWEPDRAFDLDHHVRLDALPQPGSTRELLVLCSRLHAVPLDRQYPLWEAHLIEGLADGRFALYFKVHHAVVDGAHALILLAHALSEDPAERDMPPPWAVRQPAADETGGGAPASGAQFVRWAQEAAGVVPALAQTVRRALNDQSATLSLRAPRSMLNVPITGARRFAAQSWPLSRIVDVGQRAGVTVNDVVLAMCSGALRSYLAAMDALPDAPLIAMVPVALPSESRGGDGGGNSVGLVMCNLGTDLPNPALRLSAVHRSMAAGKQALQGMSRLQILATSALGLAPAGVYALLGLNPIVRPPFNLVISNVPGTSAPQYWNGARLDGLYPLSIPMDGLALNITCTSYGDELAFGLIGCPRAVPHLQRLLAHLADELAALERVAGTATDR
jgi:diacylglycerol O-acyltransferase